MRKDWPVKGRINVWRRYRDRQSQLDGVKSPRIVPMCNAEFETAARTAMHALHPTPQAVLSRHDLGRTELKAIFFQ